MILPILLAAAQATPLASSRLTAADGAGEDELGCGVAVVDLDGDGYAEVVVGARGHDGRAVNAGAIYLYPGTPDGPDASAVQQLTAADGAVGDRFGEALAAAGDVNGDGFEDLLVGSYKVDEGAEDAGAVYLYYGGPGGLDPARVDRLTATEPAARARFGRAVAAAGDLDRDGFDDVLIGAHGDTVDGVEAGAAWVFYGDASGVDAARTQKLVAPDAREGDAFGWAVAAAGDVDGDGFDDLIVGANHMDRPGLIWGAAYVFYGGAAGVDGAGAQKLTDDEVEDPSGMGGAVAPAGDVDGDGFADVVIGEAGYASNRGAVLLFHGGAAGVDAARMERLVAPDGGGFDTFGYKIAPSRDVNGDGIGDLLVAAPYDDPSGLFSGSAYVLPGTGAGLDTAGAQRLVDPRGASRDFFGLALAAGDIDGDGADDPAVGAIGDDDVGIDAGAVTVFTSRCQDDDADGSCAAFDCDDAAPEVHPGAEEVPADGTDGDCDGAELCFKDADEDGFTEDDAVVASDDLSCVDPGEGDASAPGGDCDDDDPAVHPSAAERCDGVDEDCDGAVDEAPLDPGLWYTDADGDGFGDPEAPVSACAQPSGTVDDDQDCDDGDPATWPGAPEVAGDGVDQDCDGADLIEIEDTGDAPPKGGDRRCGAAPRGAWIAPFLALLLVFARRKGM
ncbi:MAG: FG-GAP repeat protein [Alphaproteobacteria bacterium]|nr:FG-GAP repeat protein [Alphaproteobacteria bacterium]